jgi:arylsulfatase A-like enzyme
LDAEVDEFVTHVLVVSDHGESFGEGGSLAHGNRLTEVEIHVPAFLVSPTLAARRRDDVAGAIDVTPTLLALAGLRTAGDELDGRDLRREEISPPGVWGMRRTSRADRLREWRLDGRFHELPKFWFLAVDPLGHIHRGNGRRVLPTPEVLPNRPEKVQRDA